MTGISAWQSQAEIYFPADAQLILPKEMRFKSANSTDAGENRQRWHSSIIELEQEKIT